ILLIDPELRRMQVARFGADNRDWTALPRVFSELREIKLQRLQFCLHVGGRRAIDVESQYQKRLLEGARSVDLAVFEADDFAIGKEDSVSIFCWCEVDAQTTGH